MVVNRLYKILLRSQTTFLVLCTVSLIVMGLGIIGGDKGEVHLLLSSTHTIFLDYVMHYWSDAITLLSIATGIALFAYKLWYGAFFCTNVALVAIVVQAIKHCIHAPRPVLFFDDVHTHLLILVEGVKMHTMNSFPSGHTANFFIVFFTVSIFIGLNMSGKKKQLWSVLCFLLALLGAYSRIYLSQHFLIDICAGLLVACLTTILTTLFWGYYFRHFRRNEVWKYSLFARCKLYRKK